MRQQLITWLMEDIAPEIQRTGKPSEAILKFASTKNLPPAQVEAIGQLFNTAKTISYMDKSAKRGGTFPILDVPEMVAKYLEVRPKQASDSEDFAGPDIANDLPGCFANLLGVLDTGPEVMKQANENPELRSFAAKENARVRLEMLNQAQFEIQEDLRDELKKIATLFREKPSMTFEYVESNVLALDIGLKPVMEKVASVLQAYHWPVVRGTTLGENTLFDDRLDLMTKLAGIRDLGVQLETAAEMIKESATMTDEEAMKDLFAQSEAAMQNPDPPVKPAGPGKENDGDGGENYDPARSPSGKGGRGRMPDTKSPDRKNKPRTQGEAESAAPPSNKAHSDHDEGYFTPLNRGLDSAGKFMYGEMKPLLMKAMPGMNNKDQRHVDTSMQDTKHMSILQNLMMTDAVISEADPDKVVDIANTIRETAPSLAGDANVMRVILRSAVQHDGVSPFDLKGFLDTELSKQKVDFNQRHMDAHLYKGKDLPGKPVS